MGASVVFTFGLHPPTPRTRAKCPFPHSPRIRKWEPPFGKAAPPLGEKRFSEAFRYLRVLAQEKLKFLRQQELSRLGKAEKQEKDTKQHRLTSQAVTELAAG